MAAAPQRVDDHRVRRDLPLGVAEAIRAFAGEDVEAAVTYPKDARYRVDPPPTVEHYIGHSCSHRSRRV